jgi:nitrogen fixation protein FixH
VTENAYLCVFNFRLSKNTALAEQQFGEILEKMKAEKAAGITSSRAGFSEPHIDERRRYSEHRGLDRLARYQGTRGRF